MPVTVGPYGQSQPSCFDRIKMGFMMGFAVGMAAGALFGTFSCLRYAKEMASTDRGWQGDRNGSALGLGRDCVWSCASHMSGTLSDSSYCSKLWPPADESGADRASPLAAPYARRSQFHRPFLASCKGGSLGSWGCGGSAPGGTGLIVCADTCVALSWP